MENIKIGLQLFSVRDKMAEDMEGTLKAVKEMGYDCVEFAGYFDKSAEEIRSMLDNLGLECISVHQTPSLFIEEGQKAVDFLKVLGAKYAAVPWYGVEEFKNNWNNTMELFTKAGKLLADNGIQMLYHNHDFEFQKLGDELIIDKLYSTMPEKYLQPEFDTCWIKYAGYDPLEYLKNYSGRINVVHLKDFYCKEFAAGPVYALIDENGKESKAPTREERAFEFRPIGSGLQDIKAICDASVKAGAHYLIVEQDDWYDKNSLELAKQSCEYLKSIGY